MIPLTDDSEHSASSTLTADQQHPPTLANKLFFVPTTTDQHVPPTIESTRVRNRRRPKRVRFDESRNQCLANTERVAEECHESWYTEEDYQEMRNTVRQLIQELRQQQQPEDKQPDQEYSSSEILQVLLDLVLSIDYLVPDASTLLTVENKQMLAQLYNNNNNNNNNTPNDDSASDAGCILGIEMYINMQLRRTVKEHREHIKDVVYDIQQEHLAGLLGDDEVDAELRDSCLNYSQAFMLLAQLYAIAQSSSA